MNKMHNDMMPAEPGELKPTTTGIITEFALNWPGKECCSTHEIAIDEEHIFVSGQLMGQIAKLDYSGKILDHFIIPSNTKIHAGSWPHGLLLDKHNRLWVSLEKAGYVIRLNKNTGEIEQEIDVRLHAKGARQPINVAPHGIGLDADGETIWFTGKRTSTLGKINPDGSVEHFQLDTLGAVPIFLSAGPDGGIWGTEVQGNHILHMSKSGVLSECQIPTPNSVPIGIIPDPVNRDCMWFTEQNGVKFAKISLDAKIITEFDVPALQKTDVLGSLCFDRENNLWIEVYVSDTDTSGKGYDYLIKVDRSGLYPEAGRNTGLNFTIYPLPRRMSMLHRIKMDFQGNMWFTEMMADRIGKIDLMGR
ncbi:Vgb family protein [Mucilaginibacter xinganensis]|uniref:Virginiamycin B lyase n=1 Tax=Mucilaginibacter xinganensis TaxID=1234841 RepID=A0A223NYC0_9SPHI|nr:hypothetical protein [Mucilaginibacter xinganensis]ASU34571.1 virginiamycin B lyase [Mucilaginibacter xinganensis]